MDGCNHWSWSECQGKGFREGRVIISKDQLTTSTINKYCCDNYGAADRRLWPPSKISATMAVGSAL